MVTIVWIVTPETLLWKRGGGSIERMNFPATLFPKVKRFFKHYQFKKIVSILKIQNLFRI